MGKYDGCCKRAAHQRRVLLLCFFLQCCRSLKTDRPTQQPTHPTPPPRRGSGAGAGGFGDRMPGRTGSTGRWGRGPLPPVALTLALSFFAVVCVFCWLPYVGMQESRGGRRAALPSTVFFFVFAAPSLSCSPSRPIA